MQALTTAFFLFFFFCFLYDMMLQVIFTVIYCTSLIVPPTDSLLEVVRGVPLHRRKVKKKNQTVTRFAYTLRELTDSPLHATAKQTCWYSTVHSSVNFKNLPSKGETPF